MTRTRMLATLLILPVSLVVGCVTQQTASWLEPIDPNPKGQVMQVHATWENRIMVTTDSVNGGSPLPGLAGRMYLFGEEVGFPLQANGETIVDMYDATVDPPKMLERWQIDSDTLQRLGKKDTIGWGYTLFLPSQKLRPDSTRVQIHVRFMPEKAIAPLFAPVTQVSIRHDNNPVSFKEGKAPVNAAFGAPTSTK